MPLHSQMNPWQLTDHLARSVIAFDIGGTTARWGVVAPDGTIIGYRRVATPQILGTTARAQTGMQAVVDFIAAQADRLRVEYPALTLTDIGVSLGAAIDANSHTVVGSGPLFRTDKTAVPLLPLLEARLSQRCTIVNDVTAAAFDLAARPATQQVPRFAALTVSSGIAFRTFDRSADSVPVGRAHGLQGEIGHLPVDFKFRGEEADMVCACGSERHLNAYSSGIAIPALLNRLASRPENRDLIELSRTTAAAPPQHKIAALSEALRRGHRAGAEFLDAVVEPIATTVIQMLTIDPLIEQVILIGGVIQALNDLYYGTLVRLLQDKSLYCVSDRLPDYFKDMIRIDVDGDICLRGAARAASREGSRTDFRTWGNVKPIPGRVMGWTVQAAFERTYDVNILPSDDAGSQDAAANYPPAAVFVDETVWSLHRARVDNYIYRNGGCDDIFPIAIAEPDKSVPTVVKILNDLEASRVPRRGRPIFAVGGGALLDTVGFAASIYRRGIPYIRVPTTLLGMVDAGVGAKVGVNYNDAKNRIGSFYPPLRVDIDLGYLTTISERQLASGIGEVVKLALVKDSALFDRLEQRLQSSADLGGAIDLHIITESIDGMLSSLADNLWEARLSRDVDFGHTFGPFFEMSSIADILHGEAVMADIALSVELSQDRRLLSASDADRIRVLLSTLGGSHILGRVNASDAVDILLEVTRHRGGQLRMPLLTGIGAVTFVDDVSASEVINVFARLGLS